MTKLTVPLVKDGPPPQPIGCRQNPAYDPRRVSITKRPDLPTDVRPKVTLSLVQLDENGNRPNCEKYRKSNRWVEEWTLNKVTV